MNYSRIDYAIQVLKAAPKPRKFNLWYWADLTEKEWNRYVEGDRIALNGCGTAGCGIGWIASDPSVQREGFYLRVMDDHDIAPYFQGEFDFEAVQKYFGITLTAAEILFSAIHYPRSHHSDPKYVIERMELLLAAGEDLFLEMLDAKRLGPSSWIES